MENYNIDDFNMDSFFNSFNSENYNISGSEVPEGFWHALLAVGGFILLIVLVLLYPLFLIIL